MAKRGWWDFEVVIQFIISLTLTLTLTRFFIDLGWR
jgi:hypothetical protein